MHYQHGDFFKRPLTLAFACITELQLHPRPTEPCGQGLALCPSHTGLPALPGEFQTPPGLPLTFSTCCSRCGTPLPQTPSGLAPFQLTGLSSSATPSGSPSQAHLTTLLPLGHPLAHHSDFFLHIISHYLKGLYMSAYLLLVFLPQAGRT